MTTIAPADLFHVTGGAEDCTPFFEQSAAKLDQHDRLGWWGVVDQRLRNQADRLAQQGGQCMVRNLRASRAGNQG